MGGGMGGPRPGPLEPGKTNIPVAQRANCQVRSASRGAPFCGCRPALRAAPRATAPRAPSSPPRPPASPQIVVHGLPFSYENPQLKDMFKPLGQVLEAVVRRDPASGRSKGYGTVLLSTPEEASRAIEVRACLPAALWPPAAAAEAAAPRAAAPPQQPRARAHPAPLTPLRSLSARRCSTAPTCTGAAWP